MLTKSSCFELAQTPPHVPNDVAKTLLNALDSQWTETDALRHLVPTFDPRKHGFASFFAAILSLPGVRCHGFLKENSRPSKVSLLKSPIQVQSPYNYLCLTIIVIQKTFSTFFAFGVQKSPTQRGVLSGKVRCACFWPKSSF